MEAELQSGQHSEEAHKLRASVLDERVAEVSGGSVGCIFAGKGEIGSGEGEGGISRRHLVKGERL